MRSPLLLLLALVLPACTAGSGREPSLAPRAAETIDPRVPIPNNPGPVVADSAIQDRLGALLSAVRSADAKFQQQLASVERLVANAGAARSESWVEAQQALSALEASRNEGSRAMADIDAVASGQINARGGISPGNLAAINSALNEANAIAVNQGDALNRLMARLGG